MTAKGELLRSIMFPKKVDFKFYRDTYYFVLALAAVSLIGMIYTLVFMVSECTVCNLNHVLLITIARMLRKRSVKTMTYYYELCGHLY